MSRGTLINQDTFTYPESPSNLYAKKFFFQAKDMWKLSKDLSIVVGVDSPIPSKLGVLLRL
jgi:hypothetical protein